MEEDLPYSWKKDTRQPTVSGTLLFILIVFGYFIIYNFTTSLILHQPKTFFQQTLEQLRQNNESKIGKQCGPPSLLSATR